MKVDCNDIFTIVRSQSSQPGSEMDITKYIKDTNKKLTYNKFMDLHYQPTALLLPIVRF